MREFVFVFRRPPRAPASPQVMQERVQRYRAWFDDLKKRGRLVSFGMGLEEGDGRLVKDEHGSISDGPYAETKDIVVGFSVVSANDYADAVELTKGYPGFAEGSVIEIRTIVAK